MFPFSSVKSRKPRFILKALLVASFMLGVSGCDLALNYTKTDRANNSDMQDFRDGLAPRVPEIDDQKSDKSSAADIPEIQPYIAASPDTMKAVPLVSVSVNQSVPLRDILYELAQQAEYDLELDPNIRGSIIFTARNKPFDVVIERISNIAGLRYKFEDGFLRVEVDTPYHKVYKVDYLSFVRSNQGNVDTSVAVVSNESDGASTGSSYNISSDNTTDFWSELELNLQQMLSGQTTGGLKTNFDPRVTVETQSPEVAAVAPQPDANGNVQPPEAVLRVEALPVDAMPDPAVDGNGTGGSETASFSLNKQAGLIMVTATQARHKQVKSYLDDLRRSVTSQVLVEAKIFEVTLNDEYINGIEWEAITKDFTYGFLDVLDATSSSLRNNTISNAGGTIATANNSYLQYRGNDLSAFVKAISGFGTVRALASPRLTVLNNQSAVLNVATNRIWFDLDIEREEDADTGDITVETDSEINSVPEGVLINVQPSINLDNRTISMAVRPTITRIVGRVADPAAAASLVPEVNVQEIDTVVRVNSGQPIVMGGLLQDRVGSTEQGVPVLGEVPIFGSLFKEKSGLIQKTELVIFLKATLVDAPGDTIHNTDRDLYRKFSDDRRPFKL